MKNCSLFISVADDQVLHDTIISAFSDARIDVAGKPHDWQNISVTYKKGWFGRSMIIIHKRSFQYQGEEFANMMAGMMNFIGQIPAQNENIKFKLMTQIQSIKASLGIVSDGSYDMFEAGIFESSNFGSPIVAGKLIDGSLVVNNLKCLKIDWIFKIPRILAIFSNSNTMSDGNAKMQKLGIEYKPATESLNNEIKLDQLGPVVINENGTISRITNWASMSKQEQETTQRVITKRNAKRLAELEKLEKLDVTLAEN